MGRLSDFIVYVCFFAIISHSLVEGKCKQNLSGRERLILEQHNELRRRHKDTPDMCYGESDSTHTYTSGEWADKMLIVARNKGKIEHSKNEGTGENMAWSWGSRLSAPETLIVDSTHRWYNEIVDWDLANAKKKSGVVGHFTQVVWRSTEEVMCQHAVGPSNFFYVCQYYPPGNYNSPSYLKENVLPLKSGVEYDGYEQMKDLFQERVQNGDFKNGKDNENEKKKKNEKEKKDKKEKEKEEEREKEKEKENEDNREREKERKEEEKADEEEKENREEEEEEKEKEKEEKNNEYKEHEDRRTGLDESKKKNREYEEHEDRRTGLDENKKKKKKEKEEKDREDDDEETSTEEYDDYERYDGGRRQSKKGGSAEGYPIISLVVKISMLCVIMVLLVIIYRKK